MRLSLLLVTFMLVAAQCQDCTVKGKQCNAHEQCCGGCCFDKHCMDTFRSCLEDLNVCKGHACRGEEICVPYQPRQCLGCEPLPICREKRET
ncbi:unnamed protein product, partial [Brenthis ino]